MNKSVYYYFPMVQKEYTKEQLIDICTGICKPYITKPDCATHERSAVIGRTRGDGDAKLWCCPAYYRRRTRWI